MKRSVLSLIAICVMFIACNNEPKLVVNQPSDIDSSENGDPKQANEFLKKFESPAQKFSVSGNKSSVIKGKKGTRIYLNPNDLETINGQPIGNNIDVALKELTNQQELIWNNATTTSNGKLLVSGGAYYIGMSSNGAKLKLKDGKSLKVQFPKKANQKMSLFYGTRNEAGQMNWDYANIDFKRSQIKKSVSDTTVLIKKGKKSEIDAIMDYVDNVDSSVANSTDEVKYIGDQSLYDEIELNKLGWINCDYFLNVEVSNLNILLDKNYKYLNALLVFKNINSITNAYPDGRKVQFANMPVGYKARLITYAIEHDKILAYSSDIVIAKNNDIKISLLPINEADFKKLLGK